MNYDDYLWFNPWIASHICMEPAVNSMAPVGAAVMKHISNF